MTKSTKQRIIYYLQIQGKVSGSQLEDQAHSWETKASVISRRARELVNEGKISRTFSERGTVQYSIRPEMSTEQANNFLKSLEKEKQGQLL